MLRNKSILFICLVFVPPCSFARSWSLADSCAELVNIYKSRQEKSLLAAQTTSLSEAVRAGYCIGVLEQYAKNDRKCRFADWYERAKFIAEAGFEAVNQQSDEKLLKESCDVR